MFTLFLGKGGVGKTTCAAAWALAQADSGHRALVVSTDPAHSLADAFGLPSLRNAVASRSRGATRSSPRRVAPRLWALELDSSVTVARWLSARRPALSRLLEHGTWLDAGDVAAVLDLPLPGIDELAAFLEVTEHERGKYDRVVIDTAPTGHTRRFFETPETVSSVAALLEAMHDRHATIAEALGGAVGRDELVEELRVQAASVERVLHDGTRTRIAWVTLPEWVAVAETLEGVAWLRARAFPLASLVINRLTPLPTANGDRRSCPECATRARYERRALVPLLEEIGRSWPSVSLHAVASMETEPRGPRALRAIGRALAAPADVRRLRGPVAGGARRSTASRSRATAPPRPTFSLAGVRLAFFGGKGGVGKSTCAAAVAIEETARDPGRPVRLISTDPAPSLGDVLGIPIGDHWARVPVPGQLVARELDAAATFKAYRERYIEAVEDAFDGLRRGTGLEIVGDRAVFTRLFELAPPGVDELLALLTVVDLLDRPGDELLVVDTAPTGHALRLLALPGDVRAWAAMLMRLMLKYRLAARVDSFAADLVQLSKRLRAFAALLADSRRARFVAVVRPAALPRLETARLFRSLRALRVAAPVLIVNGETAGRCEACRRRARGEREELARLRALCRRAPGRCDIIHAPLRLPPPTGADGLREWRAGWHRDGDDT